MTDVRLTLPERFNIADHLLLPPLEAGAEERPYLRCGAAVLTVGEAHRGANRFANVLQGLGVRRGQRVALLLRESLLFPHCFWGAVRRGAVPVPLNTVLTTRDYAHYLADSRARVLVCDRALWATVAPAVAGQQHLRHVLVTGTGGGVPDCAPGPTAMALEPALAAQPDTYATARTRPTEPAFWLYTSGSTGTPKAAVHRHQDMAFVVEAYLRRVLRLRPQDVGFSAPKLFFAYGLGNSLYFPLASGSSAVLQPEAATPATVFATLMQHRPTVVYAVPSLYVALLTLHDDWVAGRAPLPPGWRAAPTLEHLRLCLSGGEPLPAAVLARWQARFGVPILDGIGSTEALHFYTANRPGALRPGSAGLAVPGYDLRICDATGQPVPDDVPGELWLRGGSLTTRYWNRPAHNRTVLRDGWLRTGDRVRRDGEGYYWYEGRLDDLLKVGGSWVVPTEVERVLLTHPAVQECAVVGQPDAQGLIRAVAWIVPRQDAVETATLCDALRAHAAAHLAAFKVPARVVICDALPKTATGKIQRYRLRKAVSGGEHHSGKAHPPTEAPSAKADPHRPRALDRERTLA